MQDVVMWGIGIAIGLFIARECLLLYIMRTRQHGILLESPNNNFYIHRIPPSVQSVDIVLIAISIITILLYILFMYEQLSGAAVYYELSEMEVGIALLLFILYPSRKISYFITDNGLQQKEALTNWDSIYLVHLGKQPPLKRMTHIQFLARGKSIEGYIYNRDLPCLRKQLAPHSIMLIEKVSDFSGRD